MSVAQVKKRFEEFESFLRKDKEALRRLKLLKDDVNVLRTSLAAAIEAKETAEVIKSAARERADAADVERDALRLEVHSLKQQVASLMTSLESATKPAEKQIAIDDPERMIEIGVFADAKRTMKSLRKVMPHCPKAMPSDKYPKIGKSAPLFFLRQDLADGWSHNAMWQLGASMALIAAENGRVSIMDPIGLTPLGEGDASMDGFASNFLMWFDKNHHSIERREKGRGASLLNFRWGDKPGDAERTAAFLYGDDE